MNLSRGSRQKKDVWGDLETMMVLCEDKAEAESHGVDQYDNLNNIAESDMDQ